MSGFWYVCLNCGKTSSWENKDGECKSCEVKRMNEEKELMKILERQGQYESIALYWIAKNAERRNQLKRFENNEY
jgi:DNA-directed RNA polymerase subunit RPC12/RpoP